MTPAQRAAYDRRAATFATRRAALAEDICWLRDTGEHPERAAQRLGLTPDALAKNIQRLGIEWPAALTTQRRLRRSSCGEPHERGRNPPKRGGHLPPRSA